MFRRFPSPCGEKVGINLVTTDYGSSLFGTFPSPCGEKVGINRARALAKQIHDAGFPSPCGEKVGINESSSTSMFQVSRVSVPLRGKGRDQLLFRRLYLPYREVSVPLRGKGRDQLAEVLKALGFTGAEFPSPCGEKVGINYA